MIATEKNRHGATENTEDLLDRHGDTENAEKVLVVVGPNFRLRRRLRRLVRPSSASNPNVYRLHDSAGLRPNLIHVLRLEADPIALVQEPVVGQRADGHRVDGEVGDVDANGVLAIAKQSVERHAERRTPHGAGSLAVHVHHCRFSHGRVQPGASPVLERRRGDRHAAAECQYGTRG